MIVVKILHSMEHKFHFSAKMSVRNFKPRKEKLGTKDSLTEKKGGKNVTK